MSLRFLIIGGGPAGYQAATYAARLGAEVTVVERDVFGGAANLWDCIPSKTMIATGGAMSFSRRIGGMGLEAAVPQVDIVGLTERVDGIQRELNDDIIQLLRSQGVRMISGTARFTGPNPAVPAWGQPEVERRPRGVVEKCTFCYQRIDRGLAQGLEPGVDEEATPACVVACPVGARVFGDLNDEESEVSQLLADNTSYRLREDLGTGPRVYYLPAREEQV